MESVCTVAVCCLWCRLHAEAVEAGQAVYDHCTHDAWPDLSEQEDASVLSAAVRRSRLPGDGPLSTARRPLRVRHRDRPPWTFPARVRCV